MQENNFEKQVQQKMEALKINPSAEVWQKVALGIKTRKRDWKIFYLFALILLVIVTASVIWWNTFSRDMIAFSAPGKANISTKKTQENKYGDTKPATVQTKANDAENVSYVPGVAGGNHDPALLAADAFTKKSPSSVIDRDANSNTGLKDEHSGQNKIKYNSAQKTSIIISAAEPNERATLESPINNDNEDIPIETSFQVDSSFDHLLPKLIPNNITLQDAEALKGTPSMIRDGIANTYPKLIINKGLPIIQQPKWQFGFNLSLGVSNTRNGYLGIVGNSQSDDKAYSNSTPATGQNNPGSNNPVILSPVELGKAFIAGIYVQKQLTSKLAFVTGFNYKYYSTGMSLGNRIDSFSNLSSASFYYRSGNSTKYTNSYHFIELPAGLLFRLSKEKNKLPVYLYSGLSVSQLIKTSALNFNPSSGVYYRDDAIFNETQLDLSVRLLFSINKNRKRSLLLGPDLNYSLTKMAGTGLYTDRHYSYFGIHLQKGIYNK